MQDDGATSKLTWRTNVKGHDDHVTQVLGEKLLRLQWRRQFAWLARGRKDSTKEFFNRGPTIASIRWGGAIEHHGDVVIERGAEGVPIALVERGKVGVEELTCVTWCDAAGAGLS